MAQEAPHSDEETYWDLIRDPAHWQFEITAEILSSLVFTVLIAGLIAPCVRKWLKIHRREERALLELEKRVADLERERNEKLQVSGNNANVVA